MENNDALKDLIQVIADDNDDTQANNQDENVEQNGNEEKELAQTKDEVDYKALFENYKNENDNKLNALMSELEALKNPKKNQANKNCKENNI